MSLNHYRITRGSFLLPGGRYATPGDVIELPEDVAAANAYRLEPVDPYNLPPTQPGAQPMATFTVQPGNPQIVPVRSGISTVTAIPGASGSALVECSTSDTALVSGATGIAWVPWDAGTVLTTTQRGLYAPLVALRFTATGQAAVFEVL
jgi:hypothetical protein